jgi:hypothetical protein
MLYAVSSWAERLTLEVRMGIYARRAAGTAYLATCHFTTHFTNPTVIPVIVIEL